MIPVTPLVHTDRMGKAGRPPVAADIRFWNKVDASGDCWIWTGAITNGYGTFRVSPKGPRSRRHAHRYAWEALVGPIPNGLTIDHLCRVRACVNPDHLEVVTNEINIRRGFGPAMRANRAVVCRKGHWLTADNVVRGKGGARRCRACLVDYMHQRYVMRKAGK